MDPKAISPEETRRTIGVSRSKIYDLLQSGEIRSIRVGRRILVPAQAIDDFLAGTASQNKKAD